MNEGICARPGLHERGWDAVDSPELAKEEIAGLRPAREVLPPEIFEALTKRKPGERGRQKAPTKTSMSVPIDG